MDSRPRQRSRWYGWKDGRDGVRCRRVAMATLLAQRLSVRVERVPDHAFEANDGRLGQCMTIVPCHLLG